MPKTAFGEGMIGHAGILRLLSSSLEHPASAYLFTGPSKVGKRAIAEQLVSCLLGRELDDAAPLRAHPDVCILEAEEGKTMISVEQVRDVRERVSMRPQKAPRVVAYLPHADRLNESGMNALLKVIEEPPAGAVFVLVAEDASRLPATVRSRCVVLPFSIVAQDTIVEALVARGFPRQQALSRAQASRGRPGLAIEPVIPHTSIVTLRSFVEASSTGERLAMVEDVSKACESQEDVAQAWRQALEGFMSEWSSVAVDHSRECFIVGVGIAGAFRAIGGPISPRFALEASAVQLEQASSAISRVCPSHLPSSLPLIYSTDV